MPHKTWKHHCPKSGGVEIIAGGESTHWCPTCQGKEYLFDGTREEEAALREQIMREYPDARPAGV